MSEQTHTDYLNFRVRIDESDLEDISEQVAKAVSKGAGKVIPAPGSTAGPKADNIATLFEKLKHLKPSKVAGAAGIVRPPVDVGRLFHASVLRFSLAVQRFSAAYKPVVSATPTAPIIPATTAVPSPSYPGEREVKYAPSVSPVKPTASVKPVAPGAGGPGGAGGAGGVGGAGGAGGAGRGGVSLMGGFAANLFGNLPHSKRLAQGVHGLFHRVSGGFASGGLQGAIGAAQTGLGGGFGQLIKVAALHWLGTGNKGMPAPTSAAPKFVEKGETVTDLFEKLNHLKDAKVSGPSGTVRPDGNDGRLFHASVLRFSMAVQRFSASHRPAGSATSTAPGGEHTSTAPAAAAGGLGGTGTGGTGGAGGGGSGGGKPPRRPRGAGGMPGPLPGGGSMGAVIRRMMQGMSHTGPNSIFGQFVRTLGFGNTHQGLGGFATHFVGNIPNARRSMQGASALFKRASAGYATGGVRGAMGAVQQGLSGGFGQVLKGAAMRGIGGAVAGNAGAALAGAGPIGLATVAVIASFKNLTKMAAKYSEALHYWSRGFLDSDASKVMHGVVSHLEGFARVLGPVLGPIASKLVGVGHQFIDIMDGIVNGFGKWNGVTARAQAIYEVHQKLFAIKMSNLLEPIMTWWLGLKTSVLDKFGEVIATEIHLFKAGFNAVSGFFKILEGLNHFTPTFWILKAMGAVFGKVHEALMLFANTCLNAAQACLKLVEILSPITAMTGGFKDLNTSIDELRKGLNGVGGASDETSDALKKMRDDFVGNNWKRPDFHQDPKPNVFVPPAFPGRPAQHMDKGGFVFKAKGTDTIPAMLTPGEYVMPVAQTKQFLPQLQAMRNSTMGGVVAKPAVPIMRVGGSTSHVSNVSYYRFGGMARQRKDGERRSNPNFGSAIGIGGPGDSQSYVKRQQMTRQAMRDWVVQFDGMRDTVQADLDQAIKDEKPNTVTNPMKRFIEAITKVRNDIKYGKYTDKSSIQMMSQNFGRNLQILEGSTIIEPPSVGLFSAGHAAWHKRQRDMNEGRGSDGNMSSDTDYPSSPVARMAPLMKGGLTLTPADFPKRPQKLSEGAMGSAGAAGDAGSSGDAAAFVESGGLWKSALKRVKASESSADGKDDKPDGLWATIAAMVAKTKDTMKAAAPAPIIPAVAAPLSMEFKINQQNQIDIHCSEAVDNAVERLRGEITNAIIRGDNDVELSMSLYGSSLMLSTA